MESRIAALALTTVVLGCGTTVVLLRHHEHERVRRLPSRLCPTSLAHPVEQAPLERIYPLPHRPPERQLAHLEGSPRTNLAAFGVQKLLQKP